MLTQGIYTALVTPFTHDDEVDIEAFHRLLVSQQQSGITGIVIGGTTGESITLTDSELKLLLQEASSYSIPIIAGIGCACTAHSVKLARSLSLPSISAFLVVMPYYNKPTQEGIFRHIESIVRVTDTPLILYNVPHRTGVSILPQTVVKLRETFPHHIIGIKEATQDMLMFTRLRSLCGNDFLIFTGDDATLYPSLTVGSNGAISVISNIIPRVCMELFNAFQKEDYAIALHIHNSLQNYIRCLFIETNPIPIKYALSYLGIIKEYLRLPLTPLSLEYRGELEQCILTWSKTKHERDIAMSSCL